MDRGSGSSYAAERHSVIGLYYKYQRRRRLLIIFTMAYSGRKRVYAGPTRMTVVKRTKFSSNRRRSYRRRNFRRGRVGPYRQDAIQTTNGLKGTGLRYKSRLGSRSAYKNRLWNASSGSQHFRSAAMYTNLASSATLITRGGWSSWVALNPNFSTPGDGAQFPVLPTTVFARDLTIRGGKVVLNGTNTTIYQLSVKVFLMRTVRVGSVPGNGDYTAMWDPTVDAGFNTGFKVLREHKFILDPNENFSLEHRLGVRVWDFGHSGTEYVMLWGIFVQNMVADVGASLRITWGHNLSFTGDSIV